MWYSTLECSNIYICVCVFMCALTFIIPFQLSPVDTRNRVRKAIPKFSNVAWRLRPSHGLLALHSEWQMDKSQCVWSHLSEIVYSEQTNEAVLCNVSLWRRTDSRLEKDREESLLVSGSIWQRVLRRLFIQSATRRYLPLCWTPGNFNRKLERNKTIHAVLDILLFILKCVSPREKWDDLWVIQSKTSGTVLSAVSPINR